MMEHLTTEEKVRGWQLTPEFEARSGNDEPIFWQR
jgi:hypothetical protein